MNIVAKKLKSLIRGNVRYYGLIFSIIFLKLRLNDELHLERNEENILL